MRKRDIPTKGQDMGDSTPGGEFVATPLETLPMNRAVVDDRTAEPASDPPARRIRRGPDGRFQAGGASPNPKGRPASRIEGPYTVRMSRRHRVLVNGKAETITDRDVLDQAVQRAAMQGKRQARKLWEERAARDQRLLDAIAEHDAVKATIKRPGPRTLAQSAAQLAQQQRISDLLYEAAQKRIGNFSEVRDKLVSMGAITKVDGAWTLSEWAIEARNRKA